MLLSEMSWPEFQRQARDSYAIVPVGAVEPHGPHLPLASDTMISEYFAERLARDLGGWVAPPIGYGVATPPYRLGGNFPGVISVSGTTFMNLVGDVLSSLAGNGVRKFVLVNSAIDNVSFLCEAARVLTEAVADTRIVIVAWWDVVGEEFRNDLATESGVPRSDDHHAAMVESSLVMHIAPSSCHPERLTSSPGSGRTPRRMRYHVFPLPPDATTDSGVVYTADKASAAIGERVADRVARNLAAAVQREFNDPGE
ncbi:creatininase family protein (plasmid) [Streptomyces sp. HU2014]|uniref:creatininase family protein n=1 Tax=Streptomyces sp. HU2014 TaxID=2939414 RepID=UPI00200F2927|nr:creatininase family protein [Streptomyces sp. HU2014]UQI49677.1 creatininase family protein [Streptomyces sp. HU2014]